MCLDENIMNLKKEDFTHEKTKYNLCYTNATRKKINKEKMDQAVEENKKGKKQKVVHLKAYAYDERSQDISLQPGMPIKARMGFAQGTTVKYGWSGNRAIGRICKTVRSRGGGEKTRLGRSGTNPRQTTTDMRDGSSDRARREPYTHMSESPPSGTWPVYRLIEASARERTPDARDSPLRRRSKIVFALLCVFSYHYYPSVRRRS
jgi:hypothetical protein